MRKHLLLLILFIITTCASAQVPGFRGKKFSIKYDIGINHPAIVGRSGKLPMLFHNVSLDYVVSRAWTVGIKYGFMTYNAPVERTVFGSEVGYYGSTGNFNSYDYKGRYTQHTVSFIAKKFFIKKGYLAPVGRYVLLGVYYQYVDDHFAKLKASGYDPYGYSEYIVQGRRGIAHYAGFSFGLGRHFVVARRMLVDLGFTISGSPFYPLNGSEEQQAVYRDLALRNLFQLRLGLGVLAF